MGQNFSNRLFETIFETIAREDRELNEAFGEGIFFAPELYISFVVGKALMKHQVPIFGAKCQWKRELNLGNGGPSDIIIETVFKESVLELHVLELKVRNTLGSYVDDINKLKKLTNLDIPTHAYFLSLTDTWYKNGESDVRIQKIKEIDQVELLGMDSFPSNNDRYKRDVHCTVALYKIA